MIAHLKRYLDHPSPHQLKKETQKKNVIKFGPPLTKPFWIRTCNHRPTTHHKHRLEAEMTDLHEVWTIFMCGVAACNSSERSTSLKKIYDKEDRYMFDLSKVY